MNISLRRECWGISWTNSWLFALGIVVVDPLCIVSRNTRQKTFFFFAGQAMRPRCWKGSKWYFQSIHTVAIFPTFGSFPLNLIVVYIGSSYYFNMFTNWSAKQETCNYYLYAWSFLGCVFGMQIKFAFKYSILSMIFGWLFLLDAN